MNRRTESLCPPPRSTTDQRRASAAVDPALGPRAPGGSADTPNRDCDESGWTCRPRGWKRKLQTLRVFDRERARLSGSADGATWPSVPSLPKIKRASSSWLKSSQRAHIAVGRLRDSAARGPSLRESPNILL